MTAAAADDFLRRVFLGEPDETPKRCWWGPKLPGHMDSCYVPAQTRIGLCHDHYEEVRG